MSSIFNAEQFRSNVIRITESIHVCMVSVIILPRIHFVSYEANNSPTVLSEVPVIYLAVFAYLCLAWLCLALPDYERNRLSYFCSTSAGLLCVTAYPVTLIALFTFVEKERIIETLKGWAVAIVAYTGALIVLWLLGELLALDKLIGYKVLLVNREVNPADENKHWAIAAKSVFGGTLTLAVCCYAFRYDSAGTYKPL